MLNDSPKKSMPLGRGGARIGAGRPRKGEGRADKAKVRAVEFGIDTEWEDASPQEAKILFERARAHKEAMLARQHELDYKEKSGQLLPRGAFKEATATVLATLAQRLRGLPDELERRYGLDADVLQHVEAAIDEVLANTADALEGYTR